MHSSVIFRFQKYVKKRVHGNEKINLLCAFKKVCWVIFRCQKYVKKGYMEMRKWDYLVTLGDCPRLLHFTLLNFPFTSRKRDTKMKVVPLVITERFC